MRKWVAKCTKCGWKNKFKGMQEAGDALDDHFDTHPDEDLPAGGVLSPPVCWGGAHYEGNKFVKD